MTMPSRAARLAGPGPGGRRGGGDGSVAGDPPPHSRAGAAGRRRPARRRIDFVSAPTGMAGVARRHRRRHARPGPSRVCPAGLRPPSSSRYCWRRCAPRFGPSPRGRLPLVWSGWPGRGPPWPAWPAALGAEQRSAPGGGSGCCSSAPVAGRVLYLTPPAGLPAPPHWASSASGTAAHVLSPLLTSGARGARRRMGHGRRRAALARAETLFCPRSGALRGVGGDAGFRDLGGGGGGERSSPGAGPARSDPGRRTGCGCRPRPALACRRATDLAPEAAGEWRRPAFSVA